MIPRKKTRTFTESGIDDEWILLNLDSGHFHSLTGVALDIWQAIDGVRPLADIQALIEERYAVDPETCVAEVTSFVGQLQAAGFVDAA